jgi:hypothetical protein
MDKVKYLKYKAKYLNLKKQKGGTPDFTTLDAGSFLFRCAPNIAELSTYQGRVANSRLCEDTHKTGLYFGSRVIISLAMCIEYNKLMEFGIFRVNNDIDSIIKGKYSFRDINPERYFDRDGRMIPYVKPLPEENVSHIECELQLLGPNHTFLLPEHIQDGISCLGSCEVFLSTLNPEHLNNIELIAGYRFNPAIIKSASDLHRYMIENHFPFGLQKYIDDGVVIRFI